MADAATSYDEVPYTSYSYPRTHPDRLATIGRLFGLHAPDVARCRVLELGCASGGNLIPMAEQLPGARLVGVDLSARQIAEGTAAIAELGLDNVELLHADITQIDKSWGQFDYVLCHGVFSWVPRAVQDHILTICAENLAPTGIAYVSYNTYPGWHLRESVRHMMRWHVAQFDAPAKRTEQAGALVDFLASSVADQNDPFALLLRRELDILSRTGADYLFHEHLEEHNEPCYFHQFVERLTPKGLQYLGESDVHTMLMRELPPDVAETLGRISPDIVRLEQYMDFVRNRQFRQTLLCHADVELERDLGPGLVPQFFVGFGARPAAAEIDLRPDHVHAFETLAGLTITSAQPLTKAALGLAAEAWPDVVPFDALCKAARVRLAEAGESVPEPEHARAQLAVDLLACFFSAGIELRTWRPPLCTRVSERPQVAAYARWQVGHGAFATNRRHDRVDLDPAARHVVALLDGQRDRAGIVDALVQHVIDGTLTLSKDDLPIRDAEAAREPMTAVLDQTLANLAAHAMLVDDEPAPGARDRDPLYDGGRAR